jgi:tRNA-(ms[2]io[6]A)-hydroxylase
MLALQVQTRSDWLDAVLGSFDAFLLDHAACERKASANALSLVAHYPDRRELVSAMIEVAREELEHFQQVYQILEARGQQLGGDSKDLYLAGLRAQVRNGRDAYFLDRLLIGAIAEARGHERFALLAGALSDAKLAGFYAALVRSEQRHADLFVELAHTYFAAEQVDSRLAELLACEADVVSKLPVTAALH